MAQLFYRRHYETLERVIGACYYRYRSRVARQTLDAAVATLARVLAADSPAFNEALFRQGIRLHSHADDSHP